MDSGFVREEDDFATVAVHSGYKPSSAYPNNAVTEPLVTASTFIQPQPGVHDVKTVTFLIKDQLIDYFCVLRNSTTVALEIPTGEIWKLAWLLWKMQSTQLLFLRDSAPLIQLGRSSSQEIILWSLWICMVAP